MRILLLLGLALLLHAAPAAGQSWAPGTPLPTPRYGFATIVHDGRIVVAGGIDAQGTTLDRVDRYDPAANAWARIGDLREPLANGALVVYRDTLFHLGGRDADGRVVDDVQRYDAERDRWESAGALEIPRDGLAAVELDGGIYALGGFSDEGAFLDVVEYYDAHEHAWERYDTWLLDFPRAAFACVAVGPLAYSIGGFSEAGPVGLVQRYSLAQGETSVAELSPRRGYLAAAVVGDSIFVAGGRDAAGRPLADVDAYDTRADRWTDAPPMTIPREGHGLAAIGTRLYAVGGRDAFGTPLAHVETFETDRDTATPPEHLPAGLRLDAPFPNPARDRVRIAYSLPASADMHLEVAVFDVRGRKVETLHAGRAAPGEGVRLWTLQAGSGAPVAPGVYFARLQYGPYVLVRPVVVAR